MEDLENLENEYYQQMLKEEEMQYEHREMCLDTIKKLVSDGMFREIMEVIQEESEGYLYDFKLTTEPLGELQDQDEYEFLNGIYVNQTTNGGYMGDDFAGTISIKYGDNQYLEFGYSM